MEIQSVISIKNCILMVYQSAETAFRFDIIDSTGKCYICPHSFSSINSAELMAISIIVQVISNIGQDNARE